MEAWMHGCMDDGWMSGWTDGWWMDGWWMEDEWMNV